MLTYDPLTSEAIILNSISEITILCNITEWNNQMNIKFFVLMERRWLDLGFKKAVLEYPLCLFLLVFPWIYVI